LLLRTIENEVELLDGQNPEPGFVPRINERLSDNLDELRIVLHDLENSMERGNVQ
jgi:hypothetical protein